jgi:hypothetical protein
VTQLAAELRKELPLLAENAVQLAIFFGHPGGNNAAAAGELLCDLLCEKLGPAQLL